MTFEQPRRIEPPVKMLLAVFDAGDEWEGEPLHQALMNILEAHGIAGATVLEGTTGYGAHRDVHRRGLIGAPHDRPNLLLVVDSEVKLRAVSSVVRSMVGEGIVILTDAEIIPSLSVGKN